MLTAIRNQNLKNGIMVILIGAVAITLVLTGCNKKTDKPAAVPGPTITPSTVEPPPTRAQPPVKTPSSTTEKAADFPPPAVKVAEDIEAPSTAPKLPPPRSDERMTERLQMVNFIRNFYNLTDAKVLEAVQNVPRHWFVTPAEQPYAYSDTPLPIEQEQTISQPYIVAYMTSMLDLNPDKKVLEVGTGSGYQAAVLSEFTPHVYTIEINEVLARTVAARFEKLGYRTIETKIGDGYLGWKEKGPFDAIIVTCAAEQIPPPLIEQLKPGGKMCIPVGKIANNQNLMLVEKDQNGKIAIKPLMAVRFVPLIRIK
jgi:protein-L-isoaspartate(D-aspartate) O-methyltransferase